MKLFADKLFYFFVYSNLFIAVCALLMVHQTYELLLHTNPDLNFLAFVFFATICSYSFHWYLTPDLTLDSSRIKWLNKNRKVHILFFFIGFAGAAIFSFFIINHWPWLLISAFITFLYSAPKIPHPWFRSLRKVAFGKTIFLAFVWMYITTVLPVQIEGHPWQADFLLFAASRFLLIYAICILFDYRDKDYDKSIGIRSLIILLNKKGITILFAVTVVLFIISTSLLLNYEYDYLIIVLLLIPGVIAALAYRYFTKNFSDIAYYFALDGLMALSSLLTLLFFYLK